MPLSPLKRQRPLLTSPVKAGGSLVRRIRKFSTQTVLAISLVAVASHIFNGHDARSLNSVAKVVPP